ncbi:MAG: hypothetical protein GC159_20610 [Phycisphaera sp.]|nr:hypothetical protein [Phycisphaera sp.]
MSCRGGTYDRFIAAYRFAFVVALYEHRNRNWRYYRDNPQFAAWVGERTSGWEWLEKHIGG